MDRLRLEEHAPFGASGLPIAVALVRTPDDTHSGIFFIDDDDNPACIHLAFHARLMLERPGDDGWQAGVWASPPVEPERAEHLAALCGLIARTHARRGLPYALRYLEGAFEMASGAVRLGPGCVGFTCSTFVLSVFRSDNILLLRQEEWTERGGDRLRQERLSEMLTRYKERFAIPSAHIDRVRTEIGCVRFSPVDVMVAATASTIPISFEEAQTRGPDILSRLPER